MSIISALKHDLGIVEGILIPGASASTTNTTHAIQQQIANAYGTAIKTAVTELAPNTTLTGPAKAALIVETVAKDIITKGVKAELSTLKAIVLDVVQAAYRAVEPNIGSDIVAVAAAFSANPLVAVGAEVIGSVVQAAADKTVAPAAAA